MKLTSRFSLFAFVTIFVLVLSLITPAIALADDETPPPAPTTEEPAQPPSDGNAGEEATATEDSPLPPTNETSNEFVPVQDDTTVATVLDQVPDDTQVVVINEEGETVPLASQEAADILSDSDTDPMWCPAGVTTVTVDCVARNTVTLLLSQLAAKSGAGVIYFKASPNYNTNDVVFNQITNVANLGNLTDLTLQGGWNGTTTLASTITYSGQSVFTVPVTVVWNYNVTVNNFTVQNAASTGLSIDNSTAVAGDVHVNDSVFKKTQNGYDGLDVQSGGDITLTNVTATNNTGMGSSLNSTSGTGDVSVSDSTFNDNSDDGLQVYSSSSGEVDVNNATANRNGNNGAYLSGGGEVNLTGTNTFDANNNNGLNVGSIGDINLNNVEANRNGGGGSYLDNCAWDGSTCTGSGDINLTGTNTFDANGISGLEISSTGDINLNNIDASRNTGGDGAYVDNTYGSGSIYFTGSNNFNNNENSGLEAYSYGDITFDGASDTNANRNGDDGLYLYNAYGGVANITLNNIIADFNGGHGVYAYAFDDLTLTNGYFKGNDKRGLYAQSDYGNIDISLSEFINNGMSGLRAEAYNWSSAPGEGNITLDQVFSEKNGIHGANLGAAGDLTITNSGFFNNDESGVHILGLFGDLFIDSSDFYDNDKQGFDGQNIARNVDIENSTFENNRRNGATLGDSCGCTLALDVFIDSSDFNDNGSNGLEVYSSGEINLTDINADGNDNDGVYLDNSYGTGNISVDSSDFNGNGLSGLDGSGLDAYSAADITLSDVTAECNYDSGAYLDNTSGSGDLSVSNSSFDYNVTSNCSPFASSGEDVAGLNADSNGVVALSNVEASNNGGDGANIGYNAGNWSSVLVENSVFNDNSDSPFNDDWGYGLYIDNGNGDATINNVTASGNEYDGLTVITSGNVSIDPSDFSNNGGTGVYLDAGGNVKICDTTIGNNDVGVDASNVAGSLTLGNVTFSGNTSGDYTYGGSNLFTDCNPSGGGGGGGNSSAFIPVTGGEGLTCDGTAASLTVKLANGDHVTLPCPINDFGLVDEVFEANLPGPLGDGNAFISGLSALVIRGGAPVDVLEDPIVISFLIPDGMQDAELAILHWDGTQWVEVDGQPSSDGLSFEATTNLTGTFVLVKK